MKAPRGFTLIELLIAVVIFGIVGGAITKVFINGQRISEQQMQQISLQDNLRTGVLVLPTEMREMEATGTSSDILAMTSNNIVFRAMRGLGFTCQLNANRIRVFDTAALPYYGLRNIVPGRDQLLLYVESDPDITGDEIWIPVTITSVSSGSSCSGTPAIDINVVDFTAALPNGLADVVLGGPIRVFEVVRFGLFTSGGQSWLGAMSVSGGDPGLYPVLGPLAANGVQFDYLDAAGATTLAPANVRKVQVTLRGMTESAVSRALEDDRSVRADSLVTTITLRNAGA